MDCEQPPEAQHGQQGFAWRVKWLDEPQDHDYPAAAGFLSLLWPSQEAQALVDRLKAAPVTSHPAKDVFRASWLPLLGVGNVHVERDRQRVQDGKPLSPILLVRDPGHARVIVADGYHRMCAVYSIDEDAVIPCKIA